MKIAKAKIPLLIMCNLAAFCTLFSVAAFAWIYSSTKGEELITNAGDLLVTDVTYTYYRWEFPKTDDVVIVDPSTFDTSGNAVSGFVGYVYNDTTKVYDKTVTDTDDSKTMNMYDPYLEEIYPTVNFKTNQFIKVDLNVSTVCDFNLSFSLDIDSNYVLNTNNAYHDYLSKYITMQKLATIPTTTDYTLGQIYAAYTTAFASAATATYFYNTSGTKVSSSLSIASVSSAMGGEVTDRDTYSLSYLINFDYDRTLLDSTYSDVDLFNKYVLEQDFVFKIKAVQCGI